LTKSEAAIDQLSYSAAEYKPTIAENYTRNYLSTVDVAVEAAMLLAELIVA
ncbi:hypothetical protein DYB28_004514, partial [Aphanomyces astaci]